MVALPLEGVKILDLSRLLPGPFATLLLADFGAEVIKVEDTGAGDAFRARKPQQNGVSYLYQTLNRNKKSIAVNLKHPMGKELFLRLADDADVILEQFRPGVVRRLGIDYETVRKRNPKIVYCALSGFGQESPYKNVAVHNSGYLSMAGVLGLIRGDNGRPVTGGPAMADFVAGFYAALGIMIALRRAEGTGEGQYLDVSLFDSSVSLLTHAGAAYFGGGNAQARRDLAGSRVYECKDGGYVTLAIVEPHFWENFCRFFGREDFIPHQFDEGETRREMVAFFEEAFRTRTRDEWWEALKDMDVCIGPVLDVREALSSEAVLAREMVVTCEDPIAGTMRMLGNPMKLSATPAKVKEATAAPRLGEHTRALAQSAGFGEAEVQTLIAEGALKTAD